MALHWDIREVKRGNKLYHRNEEGKKGKMKQLYETIILATIMVGIPNITEKNYEKFYNRLHFLETMNGAFFYEKKYGKLIPRYITKEEVKNMVGLKTNATSWTRSQFLKHKAPQDKF